MKIFLVTLLSMSSLFDHQSNPLLALLLYESAFINVTTFPWFPFFNMFLIEIELHNFLSFLPLAYCVFSYTLPTPTPTPPTLKLIASISLIINVS